jgi:hypothetical protein
MLLLLRSLLEGGSVEPPVVETTYSAEIDLPRNWYVKRGKKLHLFASGSDADAFIEAQEQADKAIAEAQKTSRRARKRLRDKIVTVDPIQTVDVDLLSKAVAQFELPPLPELLAQQDFDLVMQIMAIAQEMQDEEEAELMLLLLA